VPGSRSCSTPITTNRRATRLSSHPPPDRAPDLSIVPATVRFWAAARQAVGHSDELTTATTIAELRLLLTERGDRRELAKIVAISSFLVDGMQAADSTPIEAGSVVDVLPPFAGG
jgi:molybdopterin synthase sulfur carrier subunit